ncbi:MAG: signal peptidase I [Chloroflexi bacterium]|nr:signal peptidase I [Chloroflexota bacterium]MBM3172369.1 signal peptidase I [Chloroflexota bacterium]MBM4454183.1 signal peptidase I [Chloroflexota bacterium]
MEVSKLKIFRDILAPVLVALAITVVFHTAIASFKVYGSSMYPSILPGEYIMVSKAAYFVRQPQHGEVIVFHSPRDPQTDLIKRVIAVPGDTIEIKKGTVFVNSVALAEPYISEPPKYDVAHQQIIDGHFFVLGDNRNNSSDSHGGWTVPRQYIVGKAWVTYWPPQEWKTVKHYALDAGKQAAGRIKEFTAVIAPCPTK